MPIVVRSVKTGMMKRGNPRSGLGGGAKLGCWGAAIGPPTRTPAQSACIFQCLRRTKPNAKHQQQHQPQAYKKLPSIPPPDNYPPPPHLHTTYVFPLPADEG